MAWNFEPAPARGQYDRRQPREARLIEQRERLVSATALVLARDSLPTITAVVTLARVSRNTFYEYFDDLEHARTAAVLRAKQRLELGLRQAEQSARTPVERRRVLARAWFDWISSAPADAGLILRTGSAALSDAGVAFEGALRRSVADARALGVSVTAPERTAVVAVAAVAEAFGRELAGGQLASEANQRTGREVLERALVEVSLRILR
jgi:AcrR family transcriptional regulator